MYIYICICIYIYYIYIYIFDIYIYIYINLGDGQFEVIDVGCPPPHGFCRQPRGRSAVSEPMPESGLDCLTCPVIVRRALPGRV